MEKTMEQIKRALEDEVVVKEIMTLSTVQEVYEVLCRTNYLKVSYDEFVEAFKVLGIAVNVQGDTELTEDQLDLASGGDPVSIGVLTGVAANYLWSEYGDDIKGFFKRLFGGGNSGKGGGVTGSW